MTPEEAAKYYDATAAAYQLGRLDFVSALLAAIGLVLVLGGIFAFYNFRRLAKKQAKEEARRIAAGVAEKAANDYLQQELPDILREYRRFIEAGQLNGDADAMALAQEGGQE